MKATLIEGELSVTVAVGTLVSELDQPGIDVSSLVNAAGSGTHGDLVVTDPRKLHARVVHNVAALTGLTQALLRRMTGAGRDVLVNIATTAAYLPPRAWPITPPPRRISSSNGWLSSMAQRPGPGGLLRIPAGWVRVRVAVN